MYAVMKQVPANRGYVKPAFDDWVWRRAGKLHAKLETADRLAKKANGKVFEINAQSSKVLVDYSILKH